MKKILFVLVMSLMCLNIQAQVDEPLIEEDEQDSSSRKILTNYVYFAKGDSKEECLGLSYYHYMLDNGKSIDQYAISILRTSIVRMMLDKGRKLLLKFNNDSILSLKTSTAVKPYNNVYFRTFDCYRVLYTYYATEDELKEIMNNKVCKIRIEENEGFTDMTPTEYNKQFDFSGIIWECFNLIESKKKSPNSVYDNF